MLTRLLTRWVAALSLLLAAEACGPGNGGTKGGSTNPYTGTPPRTTLITQTEGTAISGAPGWRWVDFPDATCTDATRSGTSGPYTFGTSTTGLAINWGTSSDVVFFLQGGGACWDFYTCGGAASLGLDKTASTGPFGATEFATDIYARYPYSWVVRTNLPAALADATIVFIPYCTGDVHAGDAVTTYQGPPGSGLPAITWSHKGHANVMAFLKRLGATFTNPAKVVVAGSSAGGFGSLANYPAFRWYWKDARSYLVDDSGPPLIGNAIPASTRLAWYQSWNMGASLDAFCPDCRTDMSAGMSALATLYPSDRIALLEHLQDLTIRTFFGTVSFVGPVPTLAPMDGPTFEADLRALGTTVMEPTGHEKYFYVSGTAHPVLIDPTATPPDSPSPGAADWLQSMLSDSAAWASTAP